MIELQFTKPATADILCHNGRFHADDVFSTVLLSKIIGHRMKIARVDSVPTDIRRDAIVFDIGNGRFDHHQPGGNGVRENGIPYASFGLLWREYANRFCKIMHMDKNFTNRELDRFIEGIDGYDNGLFHDTKTPVQNISNCIGMFNPTWEKLSTEDMNEAFSKAVNFAEIIFDNVLENIASRLHAREELKKALEHTESDTLFLDRYLPYSSLPEMKGRINFIVYPSLRGGYNLQVINHEYAFAHPLRGLTEHKLREASDVVSAIFVHNSGKIAGVQDLNDIPRMLKHIVHLDAIK